MSFDFEIRGQLEELMLLAIRYGEVQASIELHDRGAVTFSPEEIGALRAEFAALDGRQSTYDVSFLDRSKQSWRGFH